MPLADYATLFSTSMFRERLQPDYLLRLPQLMPEWFVSLAKLGKMVPFWSLGGS